MSKYTYKRLKKPDDCGVFVVATQSFCEKPVSQWRRCAEHFAALQRDDLYETIRAMTQEERKTALDLLDDVQKRRPGWEYVPPSELPEV
jgi:hypothetical protein